MDFVTQKIANIAILKAGGDAPKNISNIRTKEFCYPVYSNGIINKGLYGFSNIFTMPANTLTVSARGTIGEVFYRNEQYLPIVRLISIIPDENIIDSRYLYYLLKSSPVEGYGSVQQQLTIPYYKKIKITYTKNLCKQKKIAEVLLTYDDLIENNNKRIELLENMAQELYKEWFVRFRFPGHKTAKFENGIPEGWEVKRMSEISKIKAGGDAPKEYSENKTDKYKYPIFSNGISNDGLYGYTDKPTVKNNSITISARGTIGFVCLRTEPYLPIVRLLSIEPNESYTTNLYLYMRLKNDTLDGYGTSQQQITVPFFKKRKILLADVNVIKLWTNIVEPYFHQIKQLKIINENLKAQRDLLLPRLMSGKLEV